jgi:hypothetical protein
MKRRSLPRILAFALTGAGRTVGVSPTTDNPEDSAPYS